MPGASCACDSRWGDAGNLPGNNPCASNADTLFGVEELLLLDASMLLDWDEATTTLLELELELLLDLAVFESLPPQAASNEQKITRLLRKLSEVCISISPRILHQDEFH